MVFKSSIVSKKMKSKKQPKSVLGKIWHFLWKENSFLSWIISLALAFIIVKFIFFPVLSLVLGTSLPLVVVESGSMHHPGSFVGNAIGLQNNFEMWWNEQGSWYTGRGIYESEAENWPLKTGLEMGDIVIVYGRGEIEVGDIIIFDADKQYPLIHRIVGIKTIDNETYYETKGDNNEGQLINEKNVPENAVIGKAVMKIPKLGWIKLSFVKLLQAFS